jgi:hypothetical protein
VTSLDNGHDSHKIRHGFFKRLQQIELATNTSSSEKFGSIHFATLFEIMATWRFLYKLPTYQRITNPAQQPRVILASIPLEFWRILCESCPSSVFSCYVSCIDQVLLRRQFARRQTLLDLRQHFFICRRRKIGQHIRDQLWGVRVNGFRQMNFIALPLCISLGSQPRVQIIGRIDHSSARRIISILTKFNCAIF